MKERLRQLRKEQKLTQTELAEVISVSQSLLSKYECRERIPDIEKLLVIAEFYDVSVDYVLGRTDKRAVNR